MAITQANIGSTTTETKTDVDAIQNRTAEAVAMFLSTSDLWIRDSPGSDSSVQLLIALKEKVAIAVAKTLTCSLQKIMGTAECAAEANVVSVLQLLVSFSYLGWKAPGMPVRPRIDSAAANHV